MERKCASQVINVAPARAHVAAIQISFTGMGRPCGADPRRSRRTSPATSRSTGKTSTTGADKNSSSWARFLLSAGSLLEAGNNSPAPSPERRSTPPGSSRSAILLSPRLKWLYATGIEAIAAHFQRSASIVSNTWTRDRNSRCSASVHVPAKARSPLLRMLPTPRLNRSRSTTVWLSDVPRRRFSRSRAAATSLGTLRTVRCCAFILCIIRCMHGKSSPQCSPHNLAGISRTVRS